MKLTWAALPYWHQFPIVQIDKSEMYPIHSNSKIEVSKNGLKASSDIICFNEHGMK